MTKIASLQDSVAQYNFPIKTIPMQGVFNDMGIIHDIDCNDRVMIIRTDTNEYLGNHSTSYRPVTHDRIVDPIVDILESMKTPYISQIQMLDGGAMMEAKFICKDICFEDPQKQDYIAFQITLRNSYNGMWSVMIQADGLRLWCMNGCVTPDKIANYRQKHNGIFNYNFEHIEHSINLFRDNEPRFREWNKTPVQETDAIKLFNKLTYTPKPTVDGRYRNETQFANLMQLWSNYRNNIGSNKWGLYNAVTHWISHPINVSSTNKTVVERNSKMLNYMSKSDSIFN
tara:strand:+ start:1765 stop:2619 length:855 start_codon:yes stop_codon:yes gene_type:complete